MDVRKCCLGLAFLGAVIAGGCTALHRVPVRPEITSDVRALQTPSGMAIIGYQTADGIFHRYRGWVRLVGPDTLLFDHRGSAAWSEQESEGRDSFRLARDQVPSLLYRSGDTGKSGVVLLGVLTAGLLALFVLAAIAFANWE